MYVWYAKSDGTLIFFKKFWSWHKWTEAEYLKKFKQMYWGKYLKNIKTKVPMWPSKKVYNSTNGDKKRKTHTQFFAQNKYSLLMKVKKPTLISMGDGLLQIFWTDVFEKVDSWYICIMLPHILCRSHYEHKIVLCTEIWKQTKIRLNWHQRCDSSSRTIYRPAMNHIIGTFHKVGPSGYYVIMLHLQQVCYTAHQPKQVHKFW